MNYMSSIDRPVHKLHLNLLRNRHFRNGYFSCRNYIKNIAILSCTNLGFIWRHSEKI